MFSGGEYTDKVDVYSFAITAWEVLERIGPFDSNVDFPTHSMIDMISYIKEGGRPKIGDGCQDVGGRMVALLVACWSGQPEDRPPFGKVVEELVEIRDGLVEQRLFFQSSVKGTPILLSHPLPAETPTRFSVLSL